MDIYEIHTWIDKCESKNKSIKKKAIAIVEAWNKDIQPEQMWRMKNIDDAICTILNINTKKIKVEVNTYNETDGERTKIVYFGKKSFFKKWERMY